VGVHVMQKFNYGFDTGSLIPAHDPQPHFEMEINLEQR
jgi:hypothetical protein